MHAHILHLPCLATCPMLGQDRALMCTLEGGISKAIFAPAGPCSSYRGCSAAEHASSRLHAMHAAQLRFTAALLFKCSRPLTPLPHHPHTHTPTLSCCRQPSGASLRCGPGIAGLQGNREVPPLATHQAAMGAAAVQVHRWTEGGAVHLGPCLGQRRRARARGSSRAK